MVLIAPRLCVCTLYGPFAEEFDLRILVGPLQLLIILWRNKYRQNGSHRNRMMVEKKSLSIMGHLLWHLLLEGVQGVCAAIAKGNYIWS